MGPVYDGIAHLLLTPEDLIPALMMAVYAGLRGSGFARRALLVLPLAWFAGGMAAGFLESGPHFLLPSFSFLLLGALVAADLSLPLSAVTALSVILGLGHGLLNGLALRDGAGTTGLVGIALAVFVLLALVSAFTVSLRRPWARIIVRVAGSWVAASGVLMFGWLVAGRG